MKYSIMTTLILAGVLTGCHHKDLEISENLTSDLEIVFDWRKAPAADPASMVTYMFGMDGSQTLRYMFDNKYGGSVRVPVGSYNTLSMNSDNTDWAKFRNTDNIDKFEVYTQDLVSLESQSLSTTGLPRARGTEEERLAATPQMMWRDRTDSIEIVPFTGKRTITLYPAEAVCHYTVDVMDISNIEYARGATIDATISGMAEGYLHGSDTGTDVPVTMAFGMSVDTSQKSLHGQFLTFGECPNTVAKHILTLYIVMSDETKRSFTYDVTDQVTGAPDPKNVYILVKGLDLPQPINSGSGFIPDVSDWDMENVDLDMKI